VYFIKYIILFWIYIYIPILILKEREMKEKILSNDSLNFYENLYIYIYIYIFFSLL